jgi:hypothetical protein
LKESSRSLCWQAAGIAPLARANESVDELAAFFIRAACVWPAVYGPVTVVRDGDR